MFDHAAFRQTATQLRDHANGYAALGLTDAQAAQWANHGFLPGEASAWIEVDIGPDDACGWGGRHIDPRIARLHTEAGMKARPNGTPCEYMLARDGQKD